MADVLNGSPARPVAEQSTAELVQRASEQITRLVRDEIALAKAELAEKGKHAGIGIGLFGGGGVLALYGVGAAVATLIIVFDLFLPLWLAAVDRHGRALRDRRRPGPDRQAAGEQGGAAGTVRRRSRASRPTSTRSSTQSEGAEQGMSEQER